mmetsp:Transcript_123864/g.358228  ORF Transcript_123864/g.358228 Transcript_123864/m.358228 type:complete len:200 (-) Transcript_123864:148-747(-)
MAEGEHRQRGAEQHARAAAAGARAVLQHDAHTCRWWRLRGVARAAIDLECGHLAAAGAVAGGAAPHGRCGAEAGRAMQDAGCIGSRRSHACDAACDAAFARLGPNGLCVAGPRDRVVDGRSARVTRRSWSLSLPMLQLLAILFLPFFPLQPRRSYSEVLCTFRLSTLDVIQHALVRFYSASAPEGGGLCAPLTVCSHHE